MATIYGDGWDNNVYGTIYSDVMYGYEGDDNMYGYEGHDDIFGGSGLDILHGGAGDDLLDGGDDEDDLYGGSGHDSLEGGYGDDFLSGDDGDDDLYGSFGNDSLYGGAGSDFLSGGADDDILSGGRGRDWLTGGTGSDTFVFEQKSSGIKSSTADTIYDWDSSVDWIDMTIAGTASNYREVRTTAKSIASAAAQAEEKFTSKIVKHVFLYNSRTDTGYLVSDLNKDGRFETGVVLKNAGLATDMGYSYII